MTDSIDPRARALADTWHLEARMKDHLAKQITALLREASPVVDVKKILDEMAWGVGPISFFDARPGGGGGFRLTARCVEDIASKLSNLRAAPTAALTRDHIRKRMIAKMQKYEIMDRMPIPNYICEATVDAVLDDVMSSIAAALTEEPDPYADGAHPCNAGSTVRPRAKSTPQGAEE